jgi:hypothetical protein
MRLNVTAVMVSSLLLTSLFIAAGYNGCSQVNFANSPEVLRQEEARFSAESRIVINGGDEYTNNQSVQLALSSPRAVEMKISDQPDCQDGTWEPFSESKAWELKSSNTKANAFARFRSLNGDLSACIADDIVHDNIPPTAAFELTSGFVTNKSDLIARFQALDELSGVASVECQKPSGGKLPCSSELMLGQLTEGSKRITIQAKDRATNISPEVALTFLVDKTPPTITINSGPAAITSATGGLITYQGQDNLTPITEYRCRIDQGTEAVCPSTFDLGTLTEGPHTFAVTAVDGAQNTSVPALWSWTIDLTAPALQFTTTPAPITNSQTGNFAFTGTDNGQPISEFECRLDSEAFAACTSPVNRTGLEKGPHSFEVRGRDGVGNWSAPLRYDWRIDLEPPAVSITEHPVAVTNETTASFAWTATDDSGSVKTTECRVDLQAFTTCNQGGTALSGLVEGPHTIEVRATDEAGNTSATASYTWTIDVTAPTIQFTSVPNPYVSVSTADVAFTGTDSSGGPVHFECRLDAGAYSACTSPNHLENLIDGGHVIFVRGIDTAGNTSAPISAAWVIDRDPPLINVTSRPSIVKTGDPISISFDVYDLGSGVDVVQCGLSTAPLASCTSHHTVNIASLPQGSYSFDILARDKVGNEAIEHVTFEVTPRQVICDPFTPVGSQACGGGLLGEIYYLDSAARSQFTASSNKSVDFFYTNGIRIDALLNLKQLFVSTRAFTDGFPNSDGQLIKDNSGNVLTEYFAFRMTSVLKIDPLVNLPGWYQLAALSDDGSVISIKPDSTSAYQPLISNDGDHSTRMGCSTKAVYLDDQTRLPVEIKYYQGPRTQIALTLMWRQVASLNSAADSMCGVSGNDAFFGPPPHTNFTDYGYATLISPQHGWKVIGSSNYVAPN